MGQSLERRLIGEILIERRLITMAQLDHVLKVQRSTYKGEFVGEIMVKLGYVSEIDIVTALVLQCHLPYIALGNHSIDPEVLQLIPAEVVRRDRLVPFDRIGNVLSVVMQNPLNEKMRKEVESLTGCHIATFISTRSDIEKAINRFYPGS